ncbi:MAG: hypothetical protein U0574_00065 [Phycisphaerales bacterium]
MTWNGFGGRAAVAALAVACVHGAAEADLLAGWHFNGMAVPVDAAIAADHGTGSIDLTAFGGSGLSWQAGSDLNAWKGDAAGDALTFTGSSLNGKSAEIVAPTKGFQGLQLSFAVRRTASGFATSTVEVWDGGNWLLAGQITAAPSTWTVVSFDLSRYAFLNAGSAKLRVKVDGASSGSGTLRLDNVRLEGSVIPAPGPAAVGAAAAAAVRRRRRR